MKIFCLQAAGLKEWGRPALRSWPDLGARPTAKPPQEKGAREREKMKHHRLLLLYIVLMPTLLSACGQPGQVQPGSPVKSIPQKRTAVDKPASNDSISDLCRYKLCSSGERLYWFVQVQKDSLNGDTDLWEPNRSAEYENRGGHPELFALCRKSVFIQAQIKTDGVFLESTNGIARVKTRAAGKSVVFRWPVAKDYQTLVLNKQQFR